MSENTNSDTEIEVTEPLEPSVLATAEDLPPIVSRLVIEIRSDGRRTMARGAMEDVATGQRVAIEADARSLVELSSLLIHSLGQTLGSVLPVIGRREPGERSAALRSLARGARSLIRGRRGHDPES